MMTLRQDSAKLQYSRLMIELINTAINLEAQAMAIVDTPDADLTNIREIIGEMSGLRRSGHRFFRTR